MIDLSRPLSLKRAFGFPIQHRLARREVLIGACWLLVPLVGWLLNMGHRIVLVHRMQHDQTIWPAWHDYRMLLRHGLITFGGMLYYYTPSVLLAVGGWLWSMPWLWPFAAVLAGIATLAIPGFMTHYCLCFDPREIYNPLRVLRRVRQGGRAYWHAWGIALCALGLSFLGLLLFGLGFLLASVWFWQVAGFSFATVFSRQQGGLPQTGQ
ncbi:MAG: hypothetical protein VXW65_01410 [Pseudomonadota bacterium]|nr:hypothetical protein [Pseudomonadota bacterium]